MLVLSLVYLPMVTSSMVGDCMLECTDYTGKKEVVRCSATECLMRDKGYNWREVPKGDTWLTTRRDSKELIIPCCPGFDESLASHKVCEGYRRFERKLSGTPVRVWLDFKMLKIYNISMAEDHYTAVMWLQMSWVDPRVEICSCGKRNEEKETRMMTLAGGDEEKIWVPDLHIWEARKFERMRGLGRNREKMKIVKEEEKQAMVVQDINFKAVLACHFNTSHFPLAKNKCSVRFGSYTQDKTKVVFEQNSRFLSTELHHSKFSFKMFPLQEKLKEVTRDQPKQRRDGQKNKIVMAYDGLQIIMKEEPGSVEYQYLVTMLILVSLALLCIILLSGQPDPIDKAGLFAMALLGSVLLFVQITTNTPHGYEAQSNPFVGFLKFSIGVIVTCFACYCILVRLTSDEVITGSMQDKMELVVLAVILPSYMVWCVLYILTNMREADREACHNLVH